MVPPRGGGRRPPGHHGALSDGIRQVTYDGHPLYFYAHEGRGEMKCHDVFVNGGNWYVVQPGGDAAAATRLTSRRGEPLPVASLAAAARTLATSSPVIGYRRGRPA